MEILNYLKKRDKIYIFIKTTGRPGNMKKIGTVPFKTVRMVSLLLTNLMDIVNWQVFYLGWRGFDKGV
jgi:hypothetical protein